LTGEQFTIEYTESARSGGFASFRKKYRDVEVLVIDDVQFLLGKTGTLIELRNTIDMLMRDQRQIILVADRGLHELAGMGTDLFARLSGGMACAIDPMDWRDSVNNKRHTSMPKFSIGSPNTAVAMHACSKASSTDSLPNNASAVAN
jgi:chromosomal replication initiation ATPase DnaA